jgi:hypothetical protein
VLARLKTVDESNVIGVIPSTPTNNANVSVTISKNKQHTTHNTQQIANNTQQRKTQNQKN